VLWFLIPVMNAPDLSAFPSHSVLRYRDDKKLNFTASSIVRLSIRYDAGAVICQPSQLLGMGTVALISSSSSARRVPTFLGMGGVVLFSLEAASRYSISWLRARQLRSEGPRAVGSINTLSIEPSSHLTGIGWAEGSGDC